MKEKININQLFQETLRQLDVKAPNDAWVAIEKRLHPKKKKRILLPIWWKVGGIAAALVVGYFLGRSDVFGGNGTNENSVVIENKKVNSIPSLNTNINPTDKLNNPKTTDSDAVATSNSSYINNAKELETSNQKNKSTTIEEKAFQNTGNSIATAYKTSVNQEKNDLISNKNSVATTNAKLKNKNSNSINTNAVKINTAISNSDTNVMAAANYSKANDRFFNTTTNNSVFKNSMQLSPNLLDKTNKNGVVTNSVNSNNPFGNQSNNQEITLKNIEITKKLDSTSVASVVPNALEELLNEKEKKSELNAEPKLNRWQVSTNIAPIYFSSLANGSPIDSKFESNQKSYNTSLSVGVGVQYAVNKKLKIRTGINNLSLDYNTNDIRFSQSVGAKTLRNVQPNLAGKLLNVQTIAESPKGPTLVDENNELQIFNGSLNQKIGYFEVPMEVSYNLLNSKLGIEVLGGFSTMVLNQNEVNIVSNGLDMTIGKANNLNALHLSGNLGLGLKYGIWKKLEARIEPIFKYQFNTFSNNDGNFRPYVFGVYSGFSYTF